MKLAPPKPGTRFGSRAGRLALFNEGQRQSDYWKQYWHDTATNAIVQSGHDGEIPELDAIIARWAPRHLPVLEAGCGPGHFVAALARRGYTAIGVEYEAQVVERARVAHPALDLRIGDVRKLEFADNSIGCYLSLGVIEHFIEGPMDVLREARRVVAPDGVALISVPFLNTLRRKFLSSEPPPEVTTGEFHQYYFGADEMVDLAHAAGFSVVDRHGYAAEAFLCREHPWFSRFWRSSIARHRIKNRLRSRFETMPRPLRDRYAHMALFVCLPR